MRGHIRKRGKKWVVVVDVGYDENGRRNQRWHSGFDTKRDASRALTEILSRLQRGDYVEPHKETVAHFMRRWLTSMRASVRPTTSEAYRTMVEVHIIPSLGGVILQRLTTAQLNALYARLLENGRHDGTGGLSPRTVAYVHTTLRKALSEAVRWQIVTRNVAEQATRPRQRSIEQRTWSATELRSFIDQVEGERLHAAYMLAATTGLRRGELLGLRWRDLDLEGRRLSVTQSLVLVGYTVTVSAPKTPQSRRSVALDLTTIAALCTHRVRQLEERMALGLGAPNADEFVFTDVDGSAIHPGQFSNRFDRLVKCAGLPRIRLHDLRHTHATLALQAGINPKVVSERLGHSSVAITLDIYSHVMPAMEEKAAEKVAALVFGA